MEEQDDEATLRYVREKIDETIGHLNIDRAKIKMAGFALPGLIDREGTSYTYLTYEQPGIKSILEEMLQIPVFIDNDSNVMAMAEHTFGVAKDVNNVLCISVNECIGLGMILNSKLYRGGIGMAESSGISVFQGWRLHVIAERSVAWKPCLRDGLSRRWQASRYRILSRRLGKMIFRLSSLLHRAGEKAGRGNSHDGTFV